MIEICWPSGIEEVIYNPQINTTLTVIEGQNVRVDEVEADVFTVYPNPTNNLLRLQSTKLNSTSVFTIYDMAGSKVMTGKANASSINVAAINAGYYIIEIVTNGEIQRTSFSKF